MKIKDLERFEDYQDDLELWRMYEHDLYNVEREIAAYNQISLPDKLKLDFNEPEYPKTVQDQVTLDEHRLKHYMINEVDLLMEYNKDLSRKEAEKIVEENKESRQEKVDEMFNGNNPLNNEENKEEDGNKDESNEQY